MIRVVVYRMLDSSPQCSVSEMFAALDKATECGDRAGIDFKYGRDETGWVYWYEFNTEEEAALFKLTYL